MTGEGRGWRAQQRRGQEADKGRAGTTGLQDVACPAGLPLAKDRAHVRAVQRVGRLSSANRKRVVVAGMMMMTMPRIGARAAAAGRRLTPARMCRRVRPKHTAQVLRPEGGPIMQAHVRLCQQIAAQERRQPAQRRHQAPTGEPRQGKARATALGAAGMTRTEAVQLGWMPAHSTRASSACSRGSWHARRRVLLSR